MPFGAGNSLQIGTGIVGGTPGRVLFVAPGPVIADSPNLQWDNANNQLLLIPGTKTAPPFSFIGDTDTGLFQRVAGFIMVSVNGTEIAQFSAPGVSSGTLNLGGAGNGSLTFSAGPLDVNAPDLFITRDAANVLAQRQGVNAQTDRKYRTFTDASNFERLSLITNTTGTRMGLFVEVAGTGVARPLAFGVAAESWAIDTSNHLTALPDNTRNIGATGATRPQNIFVGSVLQIEANQGLRLTNQVDGAGALLGTLGNAPTAGDPAFWIPITLNGATRFIPAWA